MRPEENPVWLKHGQMYRLFGETYRCNIDHETDPPKRVKIPRLVDDDIVVTLVPENTEHDVLDVSDGGVITAAGPLGESYAEFLSRWGAEHLATDTKLTVAALHEVALDKSSE